MDTTTGQRRRRGDGPNAARRRRIRRALAERDGACCFYCGHRFPETLRGATIDHLIPLRHLPGWKLANLVLACQPCNHAKADRLPQEFLRPHGFRPGLTPRPAQRLRNHLAAGVRRLTLPGPPATAPGGAEAAGAVTGH